MKLCPHNNVKKGESMHMPKHSGNWVVVKSTHKAPLNYSFDHKDGEYKYIGMMTSPTLSKPSEILSEGSKESCLYFLNNYESIMSKRKEFGWLE